ncbi:hypothetical protein BKA59DRAFT_475116 [Fusarium tricinctum]|uniref:Fucose-specific lectin n=1 Tax=Fusarium tricinctum TaxID=61284 RepID=A0A8K0WEY5_9HYPO|nr:hypothetical protein BKA59DRAFT_475116 [Fusarium tricinctum]
MVSEPTRNIAAVESGGKSYVFYINSDHKLCYLLSPTGQNTNDFDQQTIKVPDINLKVKCGSEQIAAIAWEGKGGKEIRVYCVLEDKADPEKRGYVQEICFSSSNANGWELGLLGYAAPRPYVAEGVSLSASVQALPDRAEIKLFAFEKGKDGVKKVKLYSYSYTVQDWVSKTVSGKVVAW